MCRVTARVLGQMDVFSHAYLLCLPPSVLTYLYAFGFLDCVPTPWCSVRNRIIDLTSYGNIYAFAIDTIFRYKCVANYLVIIY